MWRQLRSSRLRSQTAAEHDGADAEADGQSIYSLDPGTVNSAQSVQARTLAQGPRR